MLKVCKWPFPAIERNLLYFSLLPTLPVARVAAGIHGLQVLPILAIPTTVSCGLRAPIIIVVEDAATLKSCGRSRFAEQGQKYQGEDIKVKRNRKGAKRRERTIRIWSYEEARAVVPYVVSIMRSLRDCRLAAQQHDLMAQRITERFGKPDRTALVAQKDEAEAARKAEDRFDSLLEELHALDIYCLDAIQGLALIPFGKGNQLAWWICDIFDSEPLRFWRYHRDPLETRRGIAEAKEGPHDDSVVI